MFPEQLLNSPPAYAGDLPDDVPNLRSEAIKLYMNELASGKLARAVRRLRLQAVRLLDMNEYLGGVMVSGRRYAGIHPVPIDRIQGSEGRANDFDHSFRPIRDRNRSRWLSVATARLNGQSLPAVELIQVGEVYFVRDGHHRISVAKALGETFIDAEVSVWDIRSKTQSPLSAQVLDKPACSPGA